MVGPSSEDDGMRTALYLTLAACRQLGGCLRPWIPVSRDNDTEGGQDRYLHKIVETCSCSIQNYLERIRHLQIVLSC